MLRNKLGPVFNIVNFVFCCCFCLFCQKDSPLCRENKSFKNKKQRTLGPIVISRRANIGPALTLQRMYIYIYIYLIVFFSRYVCKKTNLYIHTMYIYAVNLLSGPSLAFLNVIIWAKCMALSGPRSFWTYSYSGFRRFVLLSYHCVCVCLFRVELSANFLKIAFFKKKVHLWISLV